jgi:hypothetical protein
MSNMENITIFPTVKKGELKTPGYVYLIRVLDCDKFLFKVGYSRNLKQRITTLYHAGYEPELIAYTLDYNPEKLEYKIHTALWKYHYSWAFEEGYPKWSNEFFKVHWVHAPEMVEIFKTIAGKNYVYSL